ncbi:MAG: NAD(P)H-dependent oxidoreductase [Firmicutes bacterium]|nr:NAD(P)H-dependent oxidoreductase [Bacillota bacterium]
MRLEVIITSTRPNRVGKNIADWFAGEALEYQGFEVSVADLAEIDLPLLDESGHPRMGQYEHQHTRDWSARISAADAFCFVMPEYNGGFPAAFKNAIDYLHNEWAYKPAAFVSYGGVSGGLRAVQMAKQVLVALKVFPIPEGITIPFVQQMIDGDGQFIPSDMVAASVKPMLDELFQVSQALKPLRNTD